MAGFRARGLAITSILWVECCISPYNIPPPWSIWGPQEWSPLLEGFLGGTGAVPALANIEVGAALGYENDEKREFTINNQWNEPKS
uniref:Uncharacterized protein n=1 Tax=Romanomermis culicivorax TaxID=13658 RepID=A0A915KPF0_ROMCU